MRNISVIKLSVILIALSISTNPLYSQNQSIRLQSITVNDGLSQSYVNTIYQDSRGYIWFGTTDGLNRYDGYNIKVYKFDPDLEQSISDNFVRCIIEDSKKRLWVGTDAGGLNLYDLNKDQFKQIPLKRMESDTFQKEQIWDLQIEADKQLRIATNDGIYTIDLDADDFLVERFTEASGTIRGIVSSMDGSGWYGNEAKGLFGYKGTEITHKPMSGIFNEATIYDLLLEGKETLWVGTKTGLFKYDIPSEEISRVSLPLTGDPPEITTLAFGPEKRLWIGTSDHGLISLDTESEKVDVFIHLPEDPYSLREAGIRKIFFDRNHLLWIATRGEGVQFFNPQTPFDYYGYNPQSINGLSHPSIRAILTDETGLWVGGYEGLDFFSKENNRRTHFGASNYGLINNNVYSLAKDGVGKLWIGTEGGGLFSLNKSTGVIDKVEFDAAKSFALDYIFELFLSQDSLLYLGTGTGLYFINPANNYSNAPQKIVLRTEQFEALDPENIIAINQDRNKNLYIGTESAGLFVINQFHEPVAHYVHDRNKRESISSNRIKVLHFDSNGQLWIGTAGGGLDQWVPESKSFIHYDENDGLADNTVYGILEDEFGSFWLSTNRGITLFDKKEGVIRNFGIESGLQGLEFNTAAFYKSIDGEMFFGGIYGLNIFSPREVRSKNIALPLIITDLKISNRSVKVGTEILPTDINSLTELTLSHKEKIVSLDFSGMNFLAPRQTRYRYMIKGIHANWIYTSPGDRGASFTNLPAGRHVLSIEAAPSSLARYGDPRTIDLNVKPAPWRAWWAYMIYMIGLLSLLWLVRRNELKKITLRTELESRKNQAQKTAELDELKSRIIANISHELRTPLTLLENHIKKLSPLTSSSGSLNTKTSFIKAQKDLSKITTLSDQLDELSRFATGTIKLKAREENLGEILSETVSGIRDAGEDKGITFRLKAGEEPVMLYLDKQKILQIIYTLLKNTMKISPPESNICLDIIDASQFNDRGIGLFVFVQLTNASEKISDKKQSEMMDRITRVEEGTGKPLSDLDIDMALVRELVELHGGYILREQLAEDEIVFLLSIPIGRFHLAPDEIMVDEGLKGKHLKVEDSAIPDPTKPKILVVEDDNELCSFIHDVLIEDYSIILARDGQEGYEAAQKNQPDLIISDIAMPRKSGLDLLKDIRQDPLLTNTPVVVLTALVSKEDRIKGYEATANDYISKPFSMDELKIRIRNILQSRKQLLETATNAKMPDIGRDSSISKADDNFFTKVKETVEKNLGNTELNAEMIAQAVFMSKRQLERKLKPMTGLSPGEFIRQVRFIRARQILQEGEVITVAEVSYAVGFKNVKYFSRLFRNQFGHSPAELLKG